MAKYNGPERRKYLRLNAEYIVSYRLKNSASRSCDITHTKNIGQGGAVITTGEKFDKDVILIVAVKFPFVGQELELNCRVVDCHEVIRDILYQTRLAFLDIDPEVFKKIGEFVEKK